MPESSDEVKIDKTESENTINASAVDSPDEISEKNTEEDIISNQESPETVVQETAKAKPEVPLMDVKEKAKSKKKLIIILFIIGLILAATTILLSYFLRKNQNQPDPIAQTPTPTVYAFKAGVVYLTGNASRIVDDRKVEIKEGDILSEGDQIVTDENSRIVLELDEGTIIRLSENTTITLSQLKPSTTQINEGQGVLFARVEKDESHKFIAVAGDVTVESLGTAFSVEKEEDNVNVKVFESEVVVKKEEGNEIQIEKDKEWSKEEDQIKNIDQKKLAENSFYEWSLEEEKLVTPTPSPTPKPTSTPAPQYQISLSASATGNGVALSWAVNGINTPNGFKVVKNESGNPVYPGDDFKYLTDSNTRSYTWEIKDGKSWHFRVCQYIDSKCGVYSNEVIVTAPSGETSTGQVSSITLSALKASASEANLSWSSNANPTKGFKIIWSKSSGPTYPTRDGDWFIYDSSPEVRSKTVGGLESGNTYYFRVCEYLGGTCGTYSNEQSIAF